MVGLRTQASCLHGSMGSQIPQSVTNNWGDIKTEEERQNQQKLLTKDLEDNGKGDTPLSLFYSQMQSQSETKVGKKRCSIRLSLDRPENDSPTLQISGRRAFCEHFKSQIKWLRSRMG